MHGHKQFSAHLGVVLFVHHNVSNNMCTWYSPPCSSCPFSSLFYCTSNLSKKEHLGSSVLLFAYGFLPTRSSFQFNFFTNWYQQASKYNYVLNHFSHHLHKSKPSTLPNQSLGTGSRRSNLIHKFKVCRLWSNLLYLDNIGCEPNGNPLLFWCTAHSIVYTPRKLCIITINRAVILHKLFVHCCS